DDLFWATVRTKSSSTETSTGRKFAQSRAYILSHELVEACSNRDGHGYTTGACEIGDICETRGSDSCCKTYDYRGWLVEYYWSNWDNDCIKGDQPVSILKFLSAIGIDGRLGLRQLAAADISIDYIASRV